MHAPPCPAFYVRGLMMIQTLAEAESLIAAATQTKNIQGDWAFFGIGQGGDLAIVAEDVPCDKIIHLFDTFWQFPLGSAEAEGHPAGACFNPCNLTALLYAVEPFNRTFQFHSGDVRKTGSEFDKPLAFAHLDMDLFASTSAAIEVINRLIVPGGQVCFHDYTTWPSVHRAVDERLDKSFRRIRTVDSQLVVERKNG